MISTPFIEKNIKVGDLISYVSNSARFALVLGISESKNGHPPRFKALHISQVRGWEVLDLRQDVGWQKIPLHRRREIKMGSYARLSENQQ